MKDQYVADINDYVKYAYLRTLQRIRENGLLVCWMLTRPDGRSDGRRLQYLNQGESFRQGDPHLFDALGQLVRRGVRSVRAIEEANLLPRARFFAEVLKDDAEARGEYFRTLRSLLAPETLLFFDPDNGLEVASRPKGRRDSSKHLFWDELEELIDPTVSTVIYQHYPRIAREAYRVQVLDKLQARLPQHRVFAVSSSHVLYLVAAAEPEFPSLREESAVFATRWPIKVSLHDHEAA